MKRRRTYLTEIGEAIRAHVWAELHVALGLRSCTRGSEVSLPALGDGQDSLGDRLPAVRVISGPYQGTKAREIRGHKGEYRYEVHYLRVLAQGEDVEGNTLEGTQAIADLFVEREDYTLPTFRQPGCLLRAAYTSEAHVEDDGELQHGDNAIGHGIVTVVVEADSFFYDAP